MSSSGTQRGDAFAGSFGIKRGHYYLAPLFHLTEGSLQKA